VLYNLLYPCTANSSPLSGDRCNGYGLQAHLPVGVYAHMASDSDVNWLSGEWVLKALSLLATAFPNAVPVNPTSIGHKVTGWNDAVGP
jgi:hypothetical protein